MNRKPALWDAHGADHLLARLTEHCDDSRLMVGTLILIPDGHLVLVNQLLFRPVFLNLCSGRVSSEEQTSWKIISAARENLLQKEQSFGNGTPEIQHRTHSQRIQSFSLLKAQIARLTAEQFPRGSAERDISVLWLNSTSRATSLHQRMQSSSKEKADRNSTTWWFRLDGETLLCRYFNATKTFNSLQSLCTGHCLFVRISLCGKMNFRNGTNVSPIWNSNERLIAYDVVLEGDFNCRNLSRNDIQVCCLDE